MEPGDLHLRLLFHTDFTESNRAQKSISIYCWGIVVVVVVVVVPFWGAVASLVVPALGGVLVLGRVLESTGLGWA